MGLVGGDENGNAESLSEVHLVGDDDKCKRVDNKNGDSKKFVFLCAVFASLNSVLLGYGWYSFFFNPILRKNVKFFVCL